MFFDICQLHIHLNNGHKNSFFYLCEMGSCLLKYIEGIISLNQFVIEHKENEEW